MRWLGRSTLLAVALCISSMNGWNHADAQCVSHPGTVSDGTPDTDALTMFVTSTSASNGNFRGGATLKGLTPAATGILAADQLCTYYAAQSTFAKASYNRNAGGGTVQFTALVSTVGINAIDRFASVSTKNIKNSNKNGEECIATNILDLFQSGYILDDRIKTESGNAASSNQAVWTGTGKYTGTPATSYADNYGYTFHAQGQTGTFASTLYQCNNWAATTGSGVTGIIGTGASVINQWLQQADANSGDTCASGFSLYCISAQPFQAPTQPPGGNGDPQFTGLQGQQFQVHGMPEEYFNLITTPTFQLNSRFTYLASGQCNYNNTECWTHPGTYVDQLGFMFPGIQIKTVAGSHRKGLRVWINSEEMKKSSGKVVMTTTTGTGIVTNSSIVGEVSVSHPHHDVLIVSSPLFTIEVTNSDWFFNFNLMFHAPEILDAGREMHYIADARSSSSATHARHLGTEVYPTYPMHGLVGQTWKNARYPAKRMYQGEVDDYMLLDHTLFSTQFMFNLYAY